MRIWAVLVLALGAAGVAACQGPAEEGKQDPGSSMATGGAYVAGEKPIPANCIGKASSLGLKHWAFFCDADGQFMQVLFESRSARLDDRARAVLDRQAAQLNRYGHYHVAIVGYVDGLEVPDSEAAKRLGRARARAAKAYLASRGVAPTRIFVAVNRWRPGRVVGSDGRTRPDSRMTLSIGRPYDLRHYGRE